MTFFALSSTSFAHQPPQSLPPGPWPLILSPTAPPQAFRSWDRTVLSAAFWRWEFRGSRHLPNRRVRPAGRIDSSLLLQSPRLVHWMIHVARIAV